MGMYTECIFGASLKTDKLGEKDLAALMYLFGVVDKKPVELPDHDFFKCDRWDRLTIGSSYYFAVRNIHRSMVFDNISYTWNCSFRSNIKNYGNEIEKFLDWIKPAIVQGSGNRDFYAIVCYGEQAEPTIYYLDKEKE